MANRAGQVPSETWSLALCPLGAGLATLIAFAFLLLNADPELDLAGLRNPAGVMAAGRWYDAATLHHLLDDVPAQIAAWIASPH